MRDELYPMIFKRKSFHLFRDIGDGRVSDGELALLGRAWADCVPLRPEIRTAMRLVPAEATSCRRGQPYCLLLYSELREGYLQNIGYLGEQLDLYLVSRGLGTLWYGLGKTEASAPDGLDFVIMLAMARVDGEERFRRDMFRSKRKAARDIWLGEPLAGVTNIVRFAPSACNAQPWLVEREGRTLRVFRRGQPGRIGLMPADKALYYNRIDMGIFLCFLDLCLRHQGLGYTRELFADPGMAADKTLNAVYTLDD